MLLLHESWTKAFGDFMQNMDKYKNKYRIPSSRLQNWDYGSNAAYFITICTAGREHYFGKIANNKMQLFEIGRIAKNEWLKTPKIRPDMNLLLDKFKSSVTTFAHKNNIKFGWQSRFHGHIIRNDIEYNRIRTYIIKNPANWPQDKFYQ